MDAPRTELVRALRVAPDLLDGDQVDGSIGYLTGHVITWGDWYEVNSAYEGRFMERIMPGASRKTITENRSAIKALFDHGKDQHIGNKVLGPFDALEEDEHGLRYGIPLLDTSYNRDLLPGLRLGLYGSSHRFRPVKDDWDDRPERANHNPDAIPERTITEISLFELGPVTFPANPQSTAGVRCISLTDEWRSRNGLAVPGTTLATPSDEPATPAEPEPREHSQGMTPGQRDYLLRRINL